MGILGRSGCEKPTAMAAAPSASAELTEMAHGRLRPKCGELVETPRGQPTGHSA